MSWEEFDDNCPGCRPAMLDVQTGQPLPADHPYMVATLSVWNQTTLRERQAWHAFTCQNSRDPEVTGLVCPLVEKIKAAIGQVES